MLKKELVRDHGATLVGLILIAAPSMSAHGQETGSTGGPSGTTGVVIETLNAGNYTYVHVDADDKQLWAAAPEFEVKVGDTITVPPGMTMSQHHSKTLNRTFETIEFVGGIRVAGAGHPPAEVGHAPSSQKPHAPAPEADLSDIAKAEGGLTVAEVFDRGEALAGKQVTVRGVVVKYSARVMGKNWIHLKDGTSSAGGKNDLTITTSGVADVGDVVLVRGTAKTKVDLGYGYFYPVLIEEANITVE